MDLGVSRPHIDTTAPPATLGGDHVGWGDQGSETECSAVRLQQLDEKCWHILWNGCAGEEKIWLSNKNDDFFKIFP